MKDYEFIINVINQATEYRLAELFYKICPNNIIYIKEEDKFFTWYNNKWNEEVKKIGSFSRLLIKSQLTKIFVIITLKYVILENINLKT
jgi:hypothetical protein